MINQHCALETKAYKVESTWIQILALFCKHALWRVYLEHAQRKDGNQRNRTKTCWCQGMLSLCSDMLPNIISRAKNHLMLFLYRFILCFDGTHLWNGHVRLVSRNKGHVCKVLSYPWIQSFRNMPCILFNVSNRKKLYACVHKITL